MFSNVTEIVKTIIYILLFSGCVFEFSPIKINPISALLKWVGHKLTKEIKDQMCEVGSKISSLEKETDTRRINDLKMRIQQFARDLKQADIQGLTDTIDLEEYDRVFDDYAEYEKLLEKYKMENGKTTRAMRSITTHYNRRGYGIEKIQ